jgi:molybdenum cofactor guanylyltransferase
MDLTAGYVLTGGRSRRMGCDKALLPLGGTNLLERTATLVRDAAGSATLVGMPERYLGLGWPALADLAPDFGPLGGLHTALETTVAEWNLLVACDMPGLREDFLRRLLAAARDSGALCLVPRTESGLHPLCAVYHREGRAAVAAAIHRKSFKMHDILNDLGAVAWPVEDSSPVENVNTPLEWGAR